MTTRHRRTKRSQSEGLVTTARVSRRARLAFTELRHKSINFEPIDFDDARSSPEWNTDERRRQPGTAPTPPASDGAPTGPAPTP